MRHLALALAITGVCSGVARSQAPASDLWKTTAGAEISAFLQDFGKASRSRDAKVHATFYAEDAEWVNAFGDKRRGRTEIEAFHARLFTHPGERDTRGALIGAPSLRLPRPDVAIVQWLILGEGQRDDAGNILPPRKTHHSVVLTKGKDGWRIENHVIMDQREPFSRDMPK